MKKSSLSAPTNVAPLVGSCRSRRKEPQHALPRRDSRSRRMMARQFFGWCGPPSVHSPDSPYWRSSQRLRSSRASRLGKLRLRLKVGRCTLAAGSRPIAGVVAAALPTRVSAASAQAPPEPATDFGDPVRDREEAVLPTKHLCNDVGPGGQLVSTVVDTSAKQLCPWKKRTCPPKATFAPRAWTLTDNRH